MVSLVTNDHSVNRHFVVVVLSCLDNIRPLRRADSISISANVSTGRFSATGTSGRCRNFERGGGERQCISLSYIIATAHNSDSLLNADSDQ